jgi:Phosphodiester glycosidase
VTAAAREDPAQVSADGIDYELTRARLRDGRETTVYLVRYPRGSTAVRVVCFAEPRRLDMWCAANGHMEAVVAGFFVRDPFRPLGEAWVGGEPAPHEPIEAPWGPRRAVVHIDGDVRLAARGDIPDEPSGDLVTAGPLLVRSGRSVVDGEDREGFSAGAGQFDSDITAERHPRCALGLSPTELLAVACDGRRTGVDAGLDLAELARLMIAFGAEEAVNLDGGGSATLVHRGHLLNRPYSSVDQPAPQSRPVVTALLFDC